MEFKDEAMLHCFRDAKQCFRDVKQGFTPGIRYWIYKLTISSMRFGPRQGKIYYRFSILIL